MNRLYIVKEYIYYFLHKHKLTKREFCKLCGIKRHTFWKIEKNMVKFLDMEEMRKVCIFMDISWDVLIVDLEGAGLLKEIIHTYYER